MYKLLVLLALLMLPAAGLTAADGFLGDTDFDVPVWDADKYLVLNQLWYEVDVYWHDGDFSKCIDTLKKVINYDSRQTEAYINAAWLLDSSDRIFEGIDMLVQGILANPRDPDPHFELAAKYYHMGGYTDAARKWENAYFYQESSLTLRMLGHAYELAGNRDKAIECYAAVVGRNPDDGAAMMNLKRMLERIPPVNDPTRLWHRPDPAD